MKKKEAKNPYRELSANTVAAPNKKKNDPSASTVKSAEDMRARRGR